MTKPQNSSSTLSLSDQEIRDRFRALRSTQDVAELLEVTVERLEWHLWKRPQRLRYRKFLIRKRNGGLREITAPDPRLKLLQSKMARVLSAVYSPGRSVHGFVRTKGIVTNAKTHLQRAYVLNVDLENFFPSIHFGRFRGLLQAWPYNLTPAAATTVAQVCFAGERQLPQGAPTSPVVANMMCQRLDYKLASLAHRNRCTYTRYSDDITISTTKRRFPLGIAHYQDGSLKLGAALDLILSTNGFKHNPQKLRLQRSSERQEVTGIVVNKSANVPRKYVRQVRAMLHAAEKFGIDDAEQEYRSKFDTKHRVSPTPVSFLGVLAGKLTYLGMVRGREDRLYCDLVNRARLLAPRLVTVTTAEDAVVVVERNPHHFMRDSIEAQGTGFALESVGVVTASHVVCDDGGQLLSGMEYFAPRPGAHHIEAVCLLKNDATDFAILRLPSSRVPRLRLGTAQTVRTGDTLTILGFPHYAEGQRPLRLECQVTGRVSRSGVERLQLSHTVHSGGSGGPVIDSAGRVVGIVVRGSQNGTTPNEVLPIDEILREAARYELDLSVASAPRCELP